MTIIPNMIREAREKTGMSQREAAKRFGVAQQQWNRWETGGRQPRADKLAELLAWLRRRKRRTTPPT